MYCIKVKGIVQGVGFRPYIYKKAKQYNLAGSVKNTGDGVEIIVNDKNFIKKLHDLPPLAKISSYTIKEIKPKEIYTGFSILRSSSNKGETILPPDIFTCKDCISELRQKDNRRHNYYFITCTNCGPRFTMIEDYPYDRSLTSMKEFEMCPECKKEYANPEHRRYHAQTIACKKCGPKLILKEKERVIDCSSDRETIKNAAALIKRGEIISIKGIGGFHICSLADDFRVNKVRALLMRKHKPFAVMVKDIDSAKKIAYMSKKEKELLESPARPIVVLKKKDKNTLKAVSELDTIGVMLPYTPLHHLLFDFIEGPLLMTSCNIPGEPVFISEKISKYFLSHERKIINRCDDSVLKVIGGNTVYLRRSRGFVPVPVKLPIEVKDTVALGSEVNNVICTAKNSNCFLSQYIGDTSKLATFEFMKETVSGFVKLTRLKPAIIACDMHPAYNSSALAVELGEKYDAKLIQVQHHKAHVAGAAAWHNLTDYVGIAMDGLGYGEDGNIWGGEVFDVSDSIGFKRIGHLEEQLLLGGDFATIYPKKMLFGILSKIVSEEEMIELKLFDEKETALYLKLIGENFNVVRTTSAGRILDAVSALLGLCSKRTYDARPAMLLESIAGEPFDVDPKFGFSGGRQILDTCELFRFLLSNMDKDKGRLAATAQMYVAKGMYAIARKHAKGKPIVFSGGVAYNSMITQFMGENGVLIDKEIPAGDGGICYGQAYLANLMHSKD